MNSTELILLLIILFLLSVIVFSFLGKLGLRTVRTFNKGRTLTEKTIYFFTNIGILAVLIFIIVGLAFFSVIDIPFINDRLDMDFLGENAYQIAFIILILTFILITGFIRLHQSSTFKHPTFQTGGGAAEA